MKKAIIIGGGPAGLTAAYELLTKTDIIPIVIEADSQVGGLSKTIDYHGNKIDIGGHRFFSKSERVIDWWLQFLPLDPSFDGEMLRIQYQHKQAEYVVPKNNNGTENIMLVRKRKSRVFYRQKLFDYPLQLNLTTLRKLGFGKTMRTGWSYVKAKLFPRRPEATLEDFFINRFGRELYETFFEDYTQKVWGVPCRQIPASWGQQRVKNLNVSKLIGHALKQVFNRNTTLNQKGTSTSLIEQFLYPKYGPGQMWQLVASEIERLGGKIMLNQTVTKIEGDGNKKVKALESTDRLAGTITRHEGEFFFSTMPVKELLANCVNLPMPGEVLHISQTLEYRDFLIVGILADGLDLKESNGQDISDNWIYVQDKNIKAGRLQFFHNWSPFMISDAAAKWIGVEYFCNETDSFWQLPDREISEQAIREMHSIGILSPASVRDTVIIRVKKAYPSYYGGYADFDKVREYLDTIENLYPVGRNGMHKYNNSDHSMLTAMTAVENIINGRTDKANIWEINTEDEYHEEKE